uniref:NADH dehydrogenase subunit 6 n=1 Tax=Schizodactylus jimo TaxID=2844906 RepID=UPI0022377FDB|nr:NADH dehydrogenase subunit 6 [Schizodactylus jimo]UYR20465.1 NADH dehydrogenase subunit 6 [Schizodactylus jimo]
MIQMILLTIMTLTSTIMITINHPLILTLLIMFQTLIICLLSGWMAQSFWFSYILFLIFLGGMLVLFIYITSLASNEMMSINMKSMYSTITILMTMAILLTFMDTFFINSFNFNEDMEIMHNSINSYNESSTHLIKLYNSPNNLITVTMILYLFLTLIVIVKITDIFQGPLRQKTYE